jgi:hypothetical protein
MLLTTRLDSDDLVSSDFVARLQGAVAGSQPPQVFNFTNGFVIHKRSVYLLRHASNAFTSLLEPVTDHPNTIFTGRHTDLADRWPIEQIDGDPGWAQLIHGGNVSNRPRGLRLSEVDLSRFPESVLDHVGPARPWSIRAENAFVRPLRSVRDHTANAFHAFVRRAIR